MKTHNWQSKALILFMGIGLVATTTALCLAATCNVDIWLYSESEWEGPLESDAICVSRNCYADEWKYWGYPDGSVYPERKWIGPSKSASCWMDMEALEPSVEIVALIARNKGAMAGVEDGSLHWIPGYYDALMARKVRIDLETQRIHREIIPKYIDRLVKNPFVYDITVDEVYSKEGLETDELIVTIEVTRMIDPRRFRPGDRPPECMDGIPVYLTHPPRPKATN